MNFRLSIADQHLPEEPVRLKMHELCETGRGGSLRVDGIIRSASRQPSEVEVQVSNRFEDPERSRKE